MSDLEIEALMNDASKTKEELVKMIMTHHESALLRYATRLVNDPNAAQDVVQNTFIKLYKGWDNGSRPDRHIKSWLYKVTHNNAVDYIRKENRVRDLHERHAEELESLKDHEKTKLKREDAMNMALEHIHQLKPNEQQVVLLRLQEGLSYREISEITNETEGNVGYLLHHAVKKLSSSLREAGAL
ncbi:MAG: RNA polymerase sigma factor (sigma-70 family) [Kiritimatiellia bacterium]|jgi:RNA polymerase sigma factor (sigma-70 family)